MGSSAAGAAAGAGAGNPPAGAAAAVGADPELAGAEVPVAPGAGAGSPRLAVYLTDGFGRFPPEPPPGIEVLWVVTPGGLETGRFPFGQVVRMVDRVPAAHPRVP